MKKYILTIMYNEDGDTVEWMQEEVIDIIIPKELKDKDVAELTPEDMIDLMDSKEYGKAWYLAPPWRRLCLLWEYIK